ncbi:MAG TPA: TM0106 family RecB-like putative nuclease [Gemmatimonadaceae bacterium]|nr:TM0106 family RecB-like putative nuclease [Gemmatimonadaceae bacterium]
MHVVERGGRQDLVLSATDLANFLGCRHRTALDLSVAFQKRKRPYRDDPLLEALWQRGLEHEKRFVDSLRGAGSLEDLTAIHDPVELIQQTSEAMFKGVDVIVQGGLSDGPWFGRPDVMRRVSTESVLGKWSYEISDTKLAKQTKAGTILQLGLYSEMLAVLQEVPPEFFHVVTPNTLMPTETFRVNDYAAYFRLVKAKMLAAVATGDEALAAANYPEPVSHCEVCQWFGECRDRRRADDHLSLVAGISRLQRDELQSQAVPTLTALAHWVTPGGFKPKRGSREGFVRVRDQARVQVESRGRAVPVVELLDVVVDRGLCRLPEPTPGDLFVDLEGDPMAAEGGREYLFGVVRTDGRYESRWAFDERDERRAFEWFMDTVRDAMAAHPKMHVYHYAPYEPSAFKRLMGRYATRERELDAMLRAGRFVDLYAVVRQSMRVGVEKYSVKSLEPLYGFTRDVALLDANRALRATEYALQMNVVSELPIDARNTVEGYNRDDCVSTLKLRDWLECVRDERIEAGTEIPRAPLEAGDPPSAVDERSKRVEALRLRLLDGISELREERDDEQQGRWLLAYLLDYHRREDKATWWDYFRLCDLAENELIDERDAVAGLEFVERLGFATGKKGKPTKSVIDRYRFPEQECDIERGKEVKLQDKRAFGTVVAIDRTARTIDVLKGPGVAEVHPSSMFAFTHIRSKEIEEALSRIGDAIVSSSDGFAAARTLLGRTTPRLKGHVFRQEDGEAELQFAVRICNELAETILPVQGPPGAGKTHCGARMICALVKAGKRVGVAANSHKAIRLLLDKTAEAAPEFGISIRLGHKNGEDPAASSQTAVREFDDNEEALAALRDGEIDVLGATSWLWSRAEAASSVEVLFVDEAGQLSLANAVAVSQAANSLVLLGDPQQLEQPRKGSHPDGVGVSALDHLLGDARTLPRDRGIFLPVTWRLAPSICRFTSEQFYDDRLSARSGNDALALVGVDGMPTRGLAVVEVAHEANRNASDEEAVAVARIVRQLLNGPQWIDAKGASHPIGGGDILVVAPYNAHVTRLSARLGGSGVRVGTVDKFQGQEAPVVIYSMATSRPEDAPRGMEFLYSLNRLNVATSRAKCLAIVVASPFLFEPECQSPRQMKLASALCHFRELATPIDLGTTSSISADVAQWLKSPVIDPLAST